MMKVLEELTDFHPKANMDICANIIAILQRLFSSFVSISSE